MATMEDILQLECDDTATFSENACAMQRVINDGTGWSLQGSMGRSMMEAIRSATCMLGKEPRKDYYGNTIPSRYDVKDGSSGSRAFIVKHRGEEWAAMLEAAEVQS